MEETIKTLVYIHAFFGGIGLISGLGSIVVKKGNSSHKKLGKLFTYAMVISSLISLIVARMPNHENLFLFLIGIFTIYMVLAGNRALTFKNKAKTKADLLDKSISGTMFIASILMIILGVVGMIQKVDNSILYLFFGAFGSFMTFKDFQTFKNFRQKKNAWLISHVGRMIGALIASFTAFLVAGLHIGTTAVWILPTVLGTVYIIYWNRKLKSKKVLKSIKL
ncbi:hypothetical protein NLM59_01860 [Weeksellaceae bacterium KMM 9724]|uniref:hypothetical protein n=1 Tax=Profundicola chukchiensis TaxID=2961959 RepID=UPI00243E57C1|nr:hypothetical protein [Profundicola chukchiensis]MDG4949657.1 hypothetical protein [Profundicola chukchiensis]